MGREVKRVPLDFDWPMGVIWPGFMGGYCSNMDYISKRKEKDSCYYCNLYRKISGEDYDLEAQHNCPNYERQVPEGDGWQMWETTSEGSAISPVFETPEKLAQWLADNKASAFGSDTATYDEWLSMIKAGWSPGAVYTPGKGLVSGVKDCGETNE
jgi:hypothetical protein